MALCGAVGGARAGCGRRPQTHTADTRTSPCRAPSQRAALRRPWWTPGTGTARTGTAALLKGGGLTMLISIKHLVRSKLGKRALGFCAMLFQWFVANKEYSMHVLGGRPVQALLAREQPHKDLLQRLIKHLQPISTKPCPFSSFLMCNFFKNCPYPYSKTFLDLTAENSKWVDKNYLQIHIK